MSELGRSRGSLAAAWAAGMIAFAWARAASPAPAVLLAVGAPGDAEYSTNFLEQASLWREAAARAGSRTSVIGLEPSPATNDLGRLAEALQSEPREDPEALWLVLIGHGTFDGQEARFNLRGPDLAEAKLAEWLRPFRRPVVVINSASASAPFLKALSGTNRVVITATRSGSEVNYTRFGTFFARTLCSTEADLDKDGQVSLLEGFLSASHQVEEFYKLEGRLSTEHALLDDNGDGLGTPAEWYSGLRVKRKSREGHAADGLVARQMHLVPSEAERHFTAEQRSRRDLLEQAVFQHREKRGQMPEDAYFRELEGLLLELARFYAAASP